MPVRNLDAARRRNTLVLAASLTLTWSVVQLAAGFAAITLSELLGRTVLVGLAPALFLAGWAAAGPPAGRFMDAHGRRRGLRLAFTAGAVVCALVWLATERAIPALFLVGIALQGVACGWLNLGARAGATDMYPAARRARGLSFVLVGAAIGAIVAPLVFAPLLGSGRAELSELALPWLVGSGIMIAGLVLTFAMRRDPLDFPAEGSDVVQWACVGDAGPSVEEFPRTEASALEAGRPVWVLVGLPGVSGALVAAVIAQVVMSSTMTVIGVALREHGHDLSSVSFTISVHFLGMFGLVLVVGYLVDRIGRRRSMAGGLFILATGVAALAAGTTFGTVLPAMFAVGVGWNVAFVAATALMADATQPHERARLLGFGDLLAAGTAAAGTIGAGAILNWAGLPALATIGSALAAAAILASLGRRGRPIPATAAGA